MIVKYLLMLGIGHLLGDFYFQNEKMSKYKEEKYKGVILHSLEYCIAVILAFLPIFRSEVFWAVIFLGLAHFSIDTVKFILLKKKKIRKNSRVFVFDQCAHVISIFALAYIMDSNNFSISYIKIVSNILNTYNCKGEIISRWIFVVLVLHKPSNIFIQSLLEGDKPRTDETIIKADNKAGRRIGTVERFIMLLFLSKGQYAAIGFILTAKSIARYDKITKDEKFAEYYLLGTLVSTLCVVICSKVVI